MVLTKRLSRLGQFAPNVLSGVLRVAENVRKDGALTSLRRFVDRWTPGIPALEGGSANKPESAAVRSNEGEVARELMDPDRSRDTSTRVRSADAATAPGEVIKSAKHESSAARSRRHEPIETVTMARILAHQGYTARARRLYERLIDRDPSNVALKAEAARLDDRD